MQNKDTNVAIEQDFEGKLKNLLNGKFKYDDDGAFIWMVYHDGGLQKIIDVRAYGQIQKMFEQKGGAIDHESANRFQDYMGQWISDALNAALINNNDNNEIAVPTDQCVEDWWAEGKNKDPKWWLESPFRTNGDVVEEIKDAIKYFLVRWQHKEQKQAKDNDGWIEYFRHLSPTYPKAYGRYEVYRAGAQKQHYEVWNTSGWAYNNNDITHYREIKSPFIPGKGIVKGADQ